MWQNPPIWYENTSRARFWWRSINRTTSYHFILGTVKSGLTGDPHTHTSTLPTIPLDYHIPPSYCCCHRKPFHPPWSSEEVLQCVNSLRIVFEMVQRFGWKVWFWYKSDHGLLCERKECVCVRGQHAFFKLQNYWNYLKYYLQWHAFITSLFILLW